MSLSQSTDIMESCIVGHPTTLETLQTTAWLDLTLQHQHLLTCLGQKGGTLKSAQSTSYDDDFVSHSLPFLSFLQPTVNSRLQHIREYNGRNHSHQRGKAH